MLGNILQSFLSSRFSLGILESKLVGRSIKLSFLNSSSNVFFLKFYFSATLRENLDPLMTHDDVQLLDALKKARLLDVVRQKLAPIDPIQGGRGLDAMIDYETTFSSGKYLLLKSSYY